MPLQREPFRLLRIVVVRGVGEHQGLHVRRRWLRPVHMSGSASAGVWAQGQAHAHERKRMRTRMLIFRPTAHAHSHACPNDQLSGPTSPHIIHCACLSALPRVLGFLWPFGASLTHVR